jgi:hypothetical protein
MGDLFKNMSFFLSPFVEKEHSLTVKALVENNNSVLVD